MSVKERDRIPPAVPEEVPDLERAIMLLGHHANGHLKPKGVKELVKLLGRPPKNAEQATAWKTSLKQLRRDEIFAH